MRVLIGCFAAILLFSTALPVCALTPEVCVQSDADLKSALSQAQLAPLIVRVVQHSLTTQNRAYDLKTTSWHNGGESTPVAGGFQIIGGYTANCVNRSIELGNTIIGDSGNISYFDGFDARGDATVLGITFTVPDGVGMSVGFNSNVNGATLLISRDAFLSSGGPFIEWGLQAGSGTIRVVDTLITQSSAFCPLDVSVYNGNPDVEIINNTVVANPAGLGACWFNDNSQGSGPHSKFYAYNNIFRGTTTGNNPADLYLYSGEAVLVDNIIGVRQGATPMQETGTTTGAPNLDANYVPQLPSPAINTGSNTVPGDLPSVDLDGNTRLVGSRVDRGALESTADFSNVQTVTSTADDGSAGTLRTALQNVHDNGGGAIKFNIGSGCGPHVITISNGELPALISDASINGYSQSGASPNDLSVGDDAEICVILEAASSGAAPGRGIVVGSAAPDSASVTIKGLAFSGFSTTGIDLQGGSGHVIVGNHFGGTVNGHALVANGIDIRLAAGTHNNGIGGSDASDRNIVGDATGSGIAIFNGSDNNQVIDNYLGLGWGGSTYTNRGNAARGLYVASNGNVITNNLIGYNGQSGIAIDAGNGGGDANIVAFNGIGADDSDVAFANASTGIRLLGDDAGPAPDGNLFFYNTIAHNGAQGILIDAGHGNNMRLNSIYNNAQLGIDLGVVGINPNDDDGGAQLVELANRGQNFPVLTSASGGNRSATVSGTLSTTSGSYTVDFYNGPGCDSSGNGEGHYWVGSATVSVPAPSGFSVRIVPTIPFFTFKDGSVITATTTDVSGNTSEFSACQSYDNDTLFTDDFEGIPPQI